MGLETRKKAWLLAVLVWFAPTPLPARGAQVGELAPSFAVRTLDGKSVALGDTTGRAPLLLVFWATWCPQCEEEVPELNRVFDTFGPRGLAMLAVNVGVNDSAARARAFVEKNDIRYPVAFDPDASMGRAYRITGLPTVILLDRKSVIVYRGHGLPDDLAARFRAAR